jgi:uncharacterized protein YdiU (UPF0061 family)
MSQLDPIQAEMRRLGIKKEEDETQRLLTSLQKSIHAIETTYTKKIEDLEELVRTLQAKLKEPVKLEINREERERIERIEEKLNRVDHTAQHAAHMTIHAFTPSPKIPWKTASDVSFVLIKEAPVAVIVPPTETSPLLNTVVLPPRKVVHKKLESRAVRSYVQQQNATLQSMAK